MGLALRYTVAGRWLYAVGSNADAAATIVANAVDVDHHLIVRHPARLRDPRPRSDEPPDQGPPA